MSLPDPSPKWSAVFSLSIGIFGLVTAEFLPASLLTPMAHDLGVSVGTAGQAVTATAVVAALAAPGVVLLAKGVDRRRIVLMMSVLLIVSNLVTAISSNLWLLLLARVALGVGLGAFWSLAAALALRLVPFPMMPRAMSIIFAGVSIANVFAAPLGAFLGDLIGWRSTFAAASVLGLVALVLQLRTMPSLPPTESPSLKTFALLLRRPSVRLGLLTVLLVISGHTAGFTYLRPFLEDVSGLPVRTLSVVFLAFGIGGLAGNFVGGIVAQRSLRAVVSASALLMGGTGAVLLAAGTTLAPAILATTAWGVAFGAFPVGVQSWATRSAMDFRESAGALFVVTWQTSIALGAVLGGVLADRAGVEGAIEYFLIAAAIGGVAMLVQGRELEPAASSAQV